MKKNILIIIFLLILASLSAALTLILLIPNEQMIIPQNLPEFETFSHLALKLDFNLIKQNTLQTEYLKVNTANSHSEKTLTLKSQLFTRTYTTSDLGFFPINKNQTENAINDGMQIMTLNNQLYAFNINAYNILNDNLQETLNFQSAEGRWDFENKRLIPGTDGQELDTEKTFELIKNAIDNNQTEITLPVTTLPSLSKYNEQLQNFTPQKTISSFSTKYSPSKNRTINVRLAASTLNGILLMPGAELSYNLIVGDRTEERGFKSAPVIEHGEMVEGIGGGACQVSSTIHAAALFANLTITERYNHSLAPSYIEMGLDAVVSYPLLDLKIKNNLKRPIVLQIIDKDNTLTAKWLSDDDIPKTRFRKEITEQIPFKEIITVDPTLEPNTYKITLHGRPGHRIQRGRITWIDGKEHFEKLNMDTYKPRNQKVSIAPNYNYPPNQEQTPKK